MSSFIFFIHLANREFTSPLQCTYSQIRFLRWFGIFRYQWTASSSFDQLHKYFSCAQRYIFIYAACLAQFLAVFEANNLEVEPEYILTYQSTQKLLLSFSLWDHRRNSLESEHLHLHNYNTIVIHNLNHRDCSLFEMHNILFSNNKNILLFIFPFARCTLVST